MKSSPQFHKALLLTVIYGLILMVQLAPVMGRSVEVVRHCGGDCAKCGCPPEQSASRTCCCWQKRSLPAEPENHAGHENHHEHEGEAAAAPSAEAAGGDLPVWSCGFPCHGDDPATILDSDEITLRCATGREAGRACRDGRYAKRAERLLSRHEAPPDPPPESSGNGRIVAEMTT